MPAPRPTQPTSWPFASDTHLVDVLQLVAELDPRHVQVVLSLHVDPEPVGKPERLLS